VHQPLEPATAGATSLVAQDGMDARTAVTPAAVLMDLPDRGQEAGIGFGPLTDRAITPGVIAGRRDLEHGTDQPHRIGVAMAFDEAEAHVRVPAKIAIDFFLRCRAPCAAVRSPGADGRSPKPGPPTSASPAVQSLAAFDDSALNLLWGILQPRKDAR